VTLFIAVFVFVAMRQVLRRWFRSSKPFGGKRRECSCAISGTSTAAVLVLILVLVLVFLVLVVVEGVGGGSVVKWEDGV
jgi:hypothetical protein